MTQHLKKMSIRTITELFKLQEVDCSNNPNIIQRTEGFLYPNYLSSVHPYNMACLELVYFIYYRDAQYGFEAHISSIDDSSVAILGPLEICAKAISRFKKFDNFIRNEIISFQCPSDEELRKIAQNIGCSIVF